MNHPSQISRVPIPHATTAETRTLSSSWILCPVSAASPHGSLSWSTRRRHRHSLTEHAIVWQSARRRSILRKSRALFDFQSLLKRYGAAVLLTMAGPERCRPVSDWRPTLSGADGRPDLSVGRSAEVTAPWGVVQSRPEHTRHDWHQQPDRARHKPIVKRRT